MIIVEKTLISDDVCNAFFACDLNLCKGNCCVEGDYGAPLEENEIAVIEDEIEHIKPYMTKEGIAVVNSIGVFEFDIEGVFVTPLVTNKQCAFVYQEKNISWCAIEKAFLEKKITFQKPISCHLYPIRIIKQPEYDAINYHRWDICQDACKTGADRKMPLYKYLKEPLIRKYGEEWYEILEKYLEFKNKKRD